MDQESRHTSVFPGWRHGVGCSCSHASRHPSSLSDFWQDSVPLRGMGFGLHFSLAIGWCLPSISCHMGLANVAACFIKAHKPVQQTEATVFWNLITEVTSHYFCHISFVRSKLLGPAHTQGKGLYTSESARNGITDSHCFFFLVEILR